MENKGRITELSSLFPAEEAQKASLRVQDAIAERQQQLNQLKGFVEDNIGLINLVQKLPDETHHNIMVPFGKAAFFPGRLIHTNEFMVLLGEGYYAERTSKQTMEILKRRGKALETQIESLKAIMQDLKVEASFFDSTAHESMEGLVEIREDYVEEGSPGTSPTAGFEKPVAIPPPKVDGGEAASEDEEYARIMSRMAELEKEEEEAENASESDGDEQIQNEQDNNISQVSTDQEVRSALVKTSEVPSISEGNKFMSKVTNLEGSSLEDSPALNNSAIDKALEPPREKKEVQSSFTGSNTAIIGSVVEHADKMGANLQIGRSSKPVSRFKMQRK